MQLEAGSRSCKTPPEAPSSPETRGSDTRGDPHPVLIVEDDFDIARAMREVMMDAGLDVEVASNGRQALDTLAAGVTPCLILLDLMMPVMDGYDFLDALYQGSATTVPPVVVVSASPGARLQDYPDVHVLRKPPDLDDLVAVVEKYCGSNDCA